MDGLVGGMGEMEMRMTSTTVLNTHTFENLTCLSKTEIS